MENNTEYCYQTRAAKTKILETFFSFIKCKVIDHIFLTRNLDLGLLRSRDSGWRECEVDSFHESVVLVDVDEDSRKVADWGTFSL